MAYIVLEGNSGVKRMHGNKRVKYNSPTFRQFVGHYIFVCKIQDYYVSPSYLLILLTTFLSFFLPLLPCNPICHNVLIENVFI